MDRNVLQCSAGAGGAGVTGASSPIAAGGQVSIITAYPWVSSHYPFLERSQAG